jgi:hypothetical protein
MTKHIILIILLISTSITQANELISSSSPYLAMHGNDPVDWRHLDRENLEEARKANKLIYISSGYFSCHWCHVMQKESYQDWKIARKLNKDFTPFKIDRELHPVVDAHLIRFIERARGYAGWPLNVFLTPEGYPVFALTYAPTEEFSDILDRLNGLWNEDPDRVRRIAISAHEEISRELNEGDKDSELSPEDLQANYINELSKVMNHMEGGFGNGSKFPVVPQLRALLNMELETEFLQITLDAMKHQHLQDQIHGGFFRYTTDPDWQTPHFEKMLYDNAQLAALYFDTGRLLDRQDYIETGLRTLKFAHRQMKSDQGGYISSLSAVDNNNIEGGYYLWTREQISELLGPRDLALMVTHLSMDKASRFDEGYLPTNLYMAPRAQWLQLNHAYQVLANARENALGTPPVDDKRISGWNGLMLSAFASCVLVTGNQWCIEEGNKLAAFMDSFLVNEELTHGLDRNNKTLGPGVLADYAQVARGYVDWWKVTRDEQLKVAAAKILNDAIKRFHGPGGWMAAEKPLLPGLIPVRHLPDQDTRSPTATLLGVAKLLKVDPLPASKATTVVVSNPYSNASLIALLNGKGPKD